MELDDLVREFLDGAPAFFRLDSRVGRNAVDADGVFPASFSAADERAVLAGRFHDEGRLFPFGVCLDHRPACDRADLLIAREQDFDIADARPSFRRNGFHRIKEGNEARLHVHNSGTVRVSVLDGKRPHSRRSVPENSIHMGHDQDFRIRPVRMANDEMITLDLLADRLDIEAECRIFVFQNLADPVDSRFVPGT